MLSELTSTAHVFYLKTPSSRDQKNHAQSDEKKEKTFTPTTIEQTPKLSTLERSQNKKKEEQKIRTKTETQNTRKPRSPTTPKANRKRNKAIDTKRGITYKSLSFLKRAFNFNMSENKPTPINPDLKVDKEELNEMISSNIKDFERAGASEYFDDDYGTYAGLNPPPQTARDSLKARLMLNTLIPSKSQKSWFGVTEADNGGQEKGKPDLIQRMFDEPTSDDKNNDDYVEEEIPGESESDSITEQDIKKDSSKNNNTEQKPQSQLITASVQNDEKAEPKEHQVGEQQEDKQQTETAPQTTEKPENVAKDECTEISDPAAAGHKKDTILNK